MTGSSSHTVPFLQRLARGVSAVSLVLLFLALTIQKIRSADFWWQINNGRWIVEHLAVPHQEMFTHSATGTPLREMRWLWCAATYLIYEHAGDWLLVLLQSAILALAWGAVACSSRIAVRTWAGAAILALAMSAGFGRYLMRPEIVTYALSTVFIVVLERHRQRPTRLIWLLPAVQVLWVNLHTLFFFGPLVVGAFVVGEFTQRFLGRGFAPLSLGERAGEGLAAHSETAGTPTPRVDPHHTRPGAIRLLPILVLTIAACWANPYFHGGAMYALEMVRQSSGGHATAEFIDEMQGPFATPISTWSWDRLIGLALVPLGAATFLANGRGFSVSRAIIFLAGVALYFMAVRNAALSALWIAWAALRNLNDRGVSRDATVPDPAPSDHRSRPRPFRSSAPSLAVSASCLLSAWYVASDRYALSMNQPRETGLGTVHWLNIEGAADFLAQNAFKGKLYNSIRDGGYLEWRLREGLPIFIDGRTDAYPEQLLRDFIQLNAGTWDAAEARWGFDVAVIPNIGYSALVAHLRSRPQWALVFLDHRAIVFSRRDGANADLVKKLELDASRVGDSEITDLPAEPWKRAIAGVARPWRSEGFAETYQSLGLTDLSIAAFRHAISAWPDSPQLAASLSQLLFEAGRIDEGEKLAAGLSEDRRIAIYIAAAGRLSSQSRFADAAAILDRAVSLRPVDRLLIVSLADAQFQAGNWAKARDAYHAALDGVVGTTNELNKLGDACDRLGDVPGSIDAWRRSLNIDQNQPVFWNFLGAAYGKQRDFARAEECFVKAVQLKPDFEQAKRNLEKVRAIRR